MMGAGSSLVIKGHRSRSHEEAPGPQRDGPEGKKSCGDRVLIDMKKKAGDAEEKSAPVKTRIPLHRLGMPLEIADLVLFLASPASDVICGHVLLIDGGYGAV